MDGDLQGEGLPAGRSEAHQAPADAENDPTGSPAPALHANLAAALHWETRYAQGRVEPALPPAERTRAKPQIVSRKLSLATADILALAALLVAVIIAIAFAMGKVEGKAATEIILGCVGGGAIAGVGSRIRGRKE